MSEHPAWLVGARGAPSAHNTQPWLFAPLPDGRIEVRWDTQRALPAGDPTRRDLYLSLGAAIESALLQCASSGTAVSFIQAREEQEQTAGYLVPTSGPPRRADLRLATALGERHTARTPHLPRRLPQQATLLMQDEAERGGCKLRIITKRDDVRRLAKLSAQATAMLLADHSVHAETWRWLRLDKRDADYARDGLIADCLELRGLPLLFAKLTMPPNRMKWLSRFGIQYLLASATQRVVERSASLCLLSGRAEDKASTIQAGQTLMRVWLVAALNKLTTQPLSALLDCPNTISPALAVFGAEGERPLSIFRLGATPSVARSTRLPIDELLAKREGE